MGSFRTSRLARGLHAAAGVTLKRLRIRFQGHASALLVVERRFRNMKVWEDLYFVGLQQRPGPLELIRMKVGTHQNARSLRAALRQPGCSSCARHRGQCLRTAVVTCTLDLVREGRRPVVPGIRQEG